MVSEISLRPIAKFAGAAMIASMAVGCRSEKVTQRSNIVSSGAPSTTAAAPMFKPDIARPIITSSLNNPYLSPVEIQWDNGTVVNRYLYDEPGIVTSLTDQNKASYRPIINSLHCDDPKNGTFCNTNTGDTGYWGCGIAVAQSALSYFGIDISRSDVNHNYIPSHSILDQIYVRPTDIYTGLINALGDYAGIGFLQYAGRGVDVHIETGDTSNDIITHLADGFPVIALTEGGAHYVLAVADNGSQFVVVNSYDGGLNQLDGWRGLDLNFDTAANIASQFQGDDNWKSGMIIYFTRIPLPQHKCPAGQKDCGVHCMPEKDNCCSGSPCDVKCVQGKCPN